MEKYKLGEMENRFAEMIWNYAPIKTRDLIAMCSKEFEWKRTTTYTMLKRLCDRGLFINENGFVTVLIPKNDFLADKGEEFLEESFGGSLPKFVAAFAKRKKLSKREIEEIQQLINDYEKE